MRKNTLIQAAGSDVVTPRELKNRELARVAVAESIVLLENDGTLPMEPCDVALYGAGAATTIKGGTGSGEVNERYSVTIEQGLKNAGFTITTDKWLREYEILLEAAKAKYNKALFKKIISSNADSRINIMAEGFQYPFGRGVTDADISGGGRTCIYVVARQAGECSERRLDKFEYNLSQAEVENLRTAASAYDKTILVINAGAPMDLSPIDDIDGINAVVHFCQQGMEGGNGLADVITGAANPSGCLSATWPQKYEDMPNAMEYSYLKGDADIEEYKEGIYVGYRYFDAFGIKPRYAFGHGLSYAEFKLDFAGVSQEKSRITVTVDVTNTGAKHPGKKTVQLYVSAPSVLLKREKQSLAAFVKTDTLAPGQTQSVNLEFDMAELAGYNSILGCFELEGGDYIISIGESSLKTSAVAVVELDERVTTEFCRKICPIDSEIDELWPPVAHTREIPPEAQRLSIKTSDFDVKTHKYEVPETELNTKAKAIMAQLGTDDMFKLVMGTGIMDKAPHRSVPGAAAYTTSHLADKGVPNTALCDGPAGLRLQRTSVKYKSGKIKPVDAAMGILSCLPKIAKAFMFGDLKKGDPLYQFASAFPVGTAMAQTWNADLIGEIGVAIGGEMKEYGATFWLAPGINIQRNPLCGRNYEYYSEDPLLTGKIAAAIIRGVQSHSGCYAAVKHYAANSQETNRNKSNSVMTERTLREIYLKGFRTAVVEGGAKAVMTSYNKLNGVYTSNSYDLCTNALRCEWGFDGVVMTDWFATGKGLACNGFAISAGNDLIMPGGSAYRKMLRKDMKDGLFSTDDLRASAARVLKAVLGS